VLAGQPLAGVTLTSKLNKPTAVVFPLKTPAVLRFVPVGIEPDAIPNVYGPVPPVPVSVGVYDWPNTEPGRVVGVIPTLVMVRVQPLAIVPESEPVSSAT
jgi:hypothetical protein